MLCRLLLPSGGTRWGVLRANTSEDLKTEPGPHWLRLCFPRAQEHEFGGQEVAPGKGLLVQA